MFLPGDSQIALPETEGAKEVEMITFKKAGTNWMSTVLKTDSLGKMLLTSCFWDCFCRFNRVCLLSK